MSATGPRLLPLDRADRPLRKGVLYGVDTRAGDEIGLLNDRLGEAAIFDFSGMALTSQAVGPKILWLQRREPEVWAKTAHLTTASSYLVLRLSGERVTDGTRQATTRRSSTSGRSSGRSASPRPSLP